MSMNIINKNPFYILDLQPKCPVEDIKRQGLKLLKDLSQLSNGSSYYRTPCGLFPRDQQTIEQAILALLDPEQRVIHEIFYVELKQEEEDTSQQSQSETGENLDQSSIPSASDQSAHSNNTNQKRNDNSV